MDTQLPSPKRGRAPNFVMDQNATWYGGRPGAGDIVLAGDPLQLPFPKRGHNIPKFSSHVLWANGRPSQLLLQHLFHQVLLLLLQYFLPVLLTTPVAGRSENLALFPRCYQYRKPTWLPVTLNSLCTALRQLNLHPCMIFYLSACYVFYVTFLKGFCIAEVTVSASSLLMSTDSGAIR